MRFSRSGEGCGRVLPVNVDKQAAGKEYGGTGGRGGCSRGGGRGWGVRRGLRGRRGAGSVETGCLLGPEGRRGGGEVEEEGREMRFSRHSRRD